MKTKTDLLRPMLALALFASVGLLRAQPASPAPAPDRPIREELRRQFESMSPEERRARLKELRDTSGARAGGQTDGDSAERRRAELRERYEDLLRKDADGSITPEEKKQLDRLETAIKRFAERPGKPPEAAPPPGEMTPGRRPQLGGWPGGQPGRYAPAFERVLTEEQRVSLREAMESQRDQMRDLEAKLRDARKDMFMAGFAAKFDEAALRQKALEAGRLDAELTVLRAKALSQMKPPLSAGQIDKLKNPPPFEGGEPRPEFRRDERPRGDRPSRGPRDEHDLPPAPKPDR